MTEIKIERWDGTDEFIISINGKPQGKTLIWKNANIIKDWLESCAIREFKAGEQQ